MTVDHTDPVLFDKAAQIKYGAPVKATAAHHDVSFEAHRDRGLSNLGVRVALIAKDGNTTIEAGFGKIPRECQHHILGTVKALAADQLKYSHA